MSFWIAGLLLAAVVVGGVAAWQWDRWGDRGDKLPDAFDYDLEPYETIDPALYLYEPAGRFAADVGRPRAVAVDEKDRIYVAGDERLRVFSPQGKRLAEVVVEGTPYCLAVAGPDHALPGAAYVAVGGRVQVLDGEALLRGEAVTLAQWPLPGERARPTSIALADKDVLVADFGQMVVLRFDLEGNLLGRIGEADKARGVPGLAMPSPFCDVAVAPDGFVWVVNPAALRLQAFSLGGRMELFWGEASSSIEGFFGCCNPANFCILPDGRFVTAEKGLLRVKVYSPHGGFRGVVAGPRELDSPGAAGEDGVFEREHKAVDVACDSAGRVVVLDLTTGSVRLFRPKAGSAEKGGTDDAS